MLEMYTKHSSKYYGTIGRKGGLERNRLHGNPGTREGRSRGGRNAIKSLKRLHITNFKFAKPVIVQRNEILAEFLGVLFGDGHVGEYQTTITLNLETDHAYALFLIESIKNNFHLSSSLRKRARKHAEDICISSVLFSRKMVGSGMVSGNKLKNGLHIPEWIFASHRYTRAFLRGLFDTDGSVYIERKKIKGKTYRYVGIIITSSSEDFREDIVQAFRNLGFAPTCRKTQKSVFLRREKDIERYFSFVSTHNPKHRVRYEMFQREKCESG